MRIASTDHRRLGVAVSRLLVDGRSVALETLPQSGWHRTENDPHGHSWRWTDGDACLPEGARVLDVEVAASEIYWRVPAPPRLSRPRPRAAWSA